MRSGDGDDGDGLTDVIERALGLDPLNPDDAAGDPDGDGLTNLEEVLGDVPPNVEKCEIGIV